MAQRKRVSQSDLEKLFEEFELETARDRIWYDPEKVCDAKSYKKIAALEADRICDVFRMAYQGREAVHKPLTHALAKLRLELTEMDAEFLCREISSTPDKIIRESPEFLNRVEDYLENSQPSQKISDYLAQAVARLNRGVFDQESVDFLARLGRLTGKTVQAEILSPQQGDTPEQLFKGFDREFRVRERTVPSLEPKGTEFGQAIFKLKPADRVQIVRLALDGTGYGVHNLRRQLMKAKLPFEHSDIETLCQKLGSKIRNLYSHELETELLKTLERLKETNEFPAEANQILQERLEKAKANDATSRKFLKRVMALVGGDNVCPIKKGEVWSDQAVQDVNSIATDDVRSEWNRLLAHCVGTDGGKPKTQWIEVSKACIEKIGDSEFCGRITGWFELVDRGKTAVVRATMDDIADPNLMIDERNAAILKGLVWCSSICNTPDVVKAMTSLALSAYKKLPGIGPRSITLGNACIYALGEIASEEAVAQLSILKARVKFGPAQKGIEKAIASSATTTGVSSRDLVEMSVPTFGLSDVGLMSKQFGDFSAELNVTGRKPEIRWFKPDGKQQKTVPAAVKNDFSDELAQLKKTAKEIEKILPAQIARIEDTFLQKREWAFSSWKPRYIDHPLVGTIARRLIWQFSKGRKKTSAIWTEQGFVDQKNKKVDWFDDEMTVQLWHPIHENKPDKVTAWRDWLMDHEIQQPFKQAHREVYLLTDAERNTGTYSNRFAAHILKQSQFRALAKTRGWTADYLGYWDGGDHGVAFNKYEAWNLRAEYWYLPVEDDDHHDVMQFVSTDQVRFYPADVQRYPSFDDDDDDVAELEPLAIEQIPGLVFSEVMRDVDLFVGVASVANDPNWSDGGPGGRFLNYWESTSFGELGASAETRKDVLSKLIPRLNIAERCQIDGRFLIVNGDHRTYRIHLGSGNILMEPNDEYLCIVPKQAVKRGADSFFLPFEGDTTLSIILSKAMLLANDKKIKDPTILSQIQPK